MSWKMNASSAGEFESAPEGTHNAVCTRLIDLGTQDVTYSGETRQRHELLVGWEIDAERADGSRHIVNQVYTLSLNEKAKLRQHIEAWRGKALAEDEEFDLEAILGKGCLLTLVRNDRGYTNVSSISGLPRGMRPLNPLLTPISFNLDAPDWETFENLSDRMQEKITKSPEYKKIRNGKPDEQAQANEDDSHAGDGAPFDDDIPF